MGDIHIGNVACDEQRFRDVVGRIAEDERCYWVGMGDYCDFINMSDPRFSPDSLAGWVQIAHLADLARAQRDRFVEIVEPIAGKCLAMLEGNHELSIARHYERAIYQEIVIRIKEAAGLAAADRLGLGFYGWLQLAFYWAADRRGGSSVVNVNLHHGFVGGRLAGAKALNMQRWLWNHAADVVIFGHSHNTGIQREAVERVDKAGKVQTDKRVGVYGGSFLQTVIDGASTYSEIKGFFPLPTGHVEVEVHPGRESGRVRVNC